MWWKTRLVAALLWAGCATTAALAQTPEDIIRWVYQSHTQPGSSNGIHHLTAPAQRAQFFSRRMVAFFEANDSYGNDLATACLDFALDIPGQDFDPQEIASTLSLSSTGEPDRPTVTASFMTFGQPAQIVYDFISEDGFMRIDDIAGPGWRVSLIPCTPKPVPSAASPTTGSYCYRRDADDLRIYVGAGGVADFRLESWQTNGHTCLIQGKAQPNSNGWTYQDQACHLGLGITPGGGIRVTDANHACKKTNCGQRAVLDRLSYTRAEQVDCTTLPPPPQY